jgi:FkbM family methyltransferase
MAWRSRLPSPTAPQPAAARPVASAPADSPELLELRATADRLRDRVDRLHRAVLDKNVLRGVLPLRVPLAKHRASLPEAHQRERRFRESSRAYRAVFDGAPAADPHVHEAVLDSLRWSVPLPQPGDPALVARALEHQDFPYRVITQTREVALGGIMLDIGANTGRMSIPRVILGDVTASYCAEPDPLNYECLMRNVRDNGLAGLVLPDRIAIGSENGVARLERGKSTGGHRVIDAETASKREVIEVELLTVDTWVERAGVDLEQLVFVKVDAQGSEVHVLRGASRVLAHRRAAWQIEIDPRGLAGRGFDASELYTLFQQHFTHFIDLRRDAPRGERVRPIGDLDQALTYLSGEPGARTDVLLFTLAESGEAAS